MEELIKTHDIDIELARFYGYNDIEELQRAWWDYVEHGQDRSSVDAVR